MNSLVLAYIGDCIYELYVRKYLINQVNNDIGKMMIEKIEELYEKRSVSL